MVQTCLQDFLKLGLHLKALYFGHLTCFSLFQSILLFTNRYDLGVQPPSLFTNCRISNAEAVQRVSYLWGEGEETLEHLPGEGPEGIINKWTTLEQNRGRVRHRKEAKGSQRISGIEGITWRNKERVRQRLLVVPTLTPERIAWSRPTMGMVLG